MKRILCLAALVLALVMLTVCSASAEWDLADGVYTGVGQGNGGEIAVEVTLQGGAIAAVTVTDCAGETPEIVQLALDALPQAIVDANGTEVDVVAGATMSSNGILEAVRNALTPADEAAESAEAQAAGVTVNGKEYPTKEAALPDWYKASDKNAKAAEDYAPRVTTMDNGVRVQLTPYDDRGWNNTFMDADMRGCNACHNLEDIVTQMESYHGVVYYKYPTTQTIATCLMCHSFYQTPLRDTIHATHMGNAAFQSMGGTCNSCHYINGDGEFERWDYVVYDHVKGITDIPAENTGLKITYDQDVLTDKENMFWKSPKVVVNEPSDWLTDDSQIIPELFDQWTVTVSGDVDNPFTMTLPEMVETFEQHTEVMSSQCCINGVGQSMIYQAEVKGILLKDIFDYAGVHDDVTTFNTACIDSYGTGANQYPLNWDYVVEHGGMLVLEMNGEPVPAGQGYPCCVWIAHTSAGNFEKYVTDLIVTKEENPAHWPLTGYFVDPSTGETFSKPNMGVLSTYNGTIFPAGETIHLEGYADAWDEPIEYMEYSMDHGNTWIKIDTPENDSWKWTYWYLDFDPPAPGAYLLRMRATSRMPDGTLRTANINTDFLMNVE